MRIWKDLPEYQIYRIIVLEIKQKYGYKFLKSNEVRLVLENPNFDAQPLFCFLVGFLDRLFSISYVIVNPWPTKVASLLIILLSGTNSSAKSLIFFVLRSNNLISFHFFQVGQLHLHLILELKICKKSNCSTFF